MNESATELAQPAPAESRDGRKRKITIRQAIKDKGVFETGVEVVEHEVEFEEDANG